MISHGSKSVKTNRALSLTSSYPEHRALKGKQGTMRGFPGAQEMFSQMRVVWDESETPYLNLPGLTFSCFSWRPRSYFVPALVSSPNQEFSLLRASPVYFWLISHILSLHTVASEKLFPSDLYGCSVNIVSVCSLVTLPFPAYLLQVHLFVFCSQNWDMLRVGTLPSSGLR